MSIALVISDVDGALAAKDKAPVLRQRAAS
jgi:hypothetical protein